MLIISLSISFSTTIGVQHVDRSTITPLRITDPVCRRTIVLAWKAGRYYSLASQKFRQFVIDYFARLASDADRLL
ncbi:hypothetical protein ACTID9_20425 [Brevibacillus fluminis]|uniref:hypothetical protein n=1 Tax=Brevibacillus fluminis TaxID=511487 RepID=UPI003F89DA52